MKTLEIARPLAAALGMVALAGVVPANAADAIPEAPPAAPAAPLEVAPVNTWSGPYAGVTLGYGFGKTRTPGNSIDTNGFVGGGFAGINGQSGNFVYGGEGDVNYNGVDGSNAGTRVKSGIDGSLRARLGYAMNDTLLLYGTAGVAGERLKVSDAAGSDTNTMLGWTAGAGIDAMLTQQLFGRVEYRYSDYGSENFNTGSGSQSVDAHENKVQVGLGLKF